MVLDNLYMVVFSIGTSSDDRQRFKTNLLASILSNSMRWCYSHDFCRHMHAHIIEREKERELEMLFYFSVYFPNLSNKLFFFCITCRHFCMQHVLKLVEKYKSFSTLVTCLVSQFRKLGFHCIK